MTTALAPFLDLRSRSFGGRVRAKPPVVPAASLPVARVVLSLSPPHLDRVFDYLVTDEQDEVAQPGVRVRVRFAGQRVDGFLLERLAESEHAGTLTPLAAVVSAEQVLTPEVALLARDVADRYAGILADVLRLAIPPRHARVEAEALPVAAGSSSAEPPRVAVEPVAVERIEAGPATGAAAPAPSWDAYPNGPALLEALAAGRSPRVTWTAFPGPGWPDAVAAAARATLASGRGTLVVVPDARDLSRVDAALTAAMGPGSHVSLTADLGPAERYRRWLRVLRGQSQVVVGTRAAAFAPVRDLGLVVCWDDGDALHSEPRAPYPHARDVLVRRAHLAGAAAIIGGLAPSVEAVSLAAAGWTTSLRPDRDLIRSAGPRVRVAGSDADLARDGAARSARIPHLAFTTLREALLHGPVLVQVPRRGYQPALTCVGCRTPARCLRCEGPIGRPGQGDDLACRWCGMPAAAWKCRNCGVRGVRATVVGARRTAEELGRAFPGVTVRTSGRDEVLLSVPSAPALVVSTPGAEPVCAGDGYAAALLLDGWAMLGRADLRAGEEALRRWMGAASLVRPGGPVIILAEPTVPAVQALLRLDPTGHSEREATERTELRFPPAARLAAVEGTPEAVAGLLFDAGAAGLPAGADVLGPVPHRLRDGTDGERALLRVPRAGGAALAAALSVAQRSRSARKAEVARVVLDPLHLV